MGTAGRGGGDGARVADTATQEEEGHARSSGFSDLAGTEEETRSLAQPRRTFDCGRWRLVYDETYTSAKKRKTNGTQPLEDVQKPVTEMDSADSESSDDALT